MIANTLEADRSAAPIAAPVLNDPTLGNGLLRVLCVIETIGLGGGAEQLLAALLPKIRGLGIDVELAALFPEEPSLGPSLEAEGIKVHHLKLSGLTAPILAVAKLRALFLQGRYHVVWSHLRLANISARIAALITRGPSTITTFHAEYYRQLKSLSVKKKLSALLEKWLLSGADAKVAVSRAVARDYKWFFGWSDIEVIYNGVDCRTLTRPSSQELTKLRESFGLSEHDFLLVMPGRCVAKKGHIHLLQALSGLKTTRGWCPRVLAFGDGPLKESLSRTAVAMGLANDITFKSAIPHQELMGILQSADGVALPSLFGEGLPMVAIEAMQVGVPLILTKVDPMLEIAGDGDCALMVPPGESQSLAAAIWNLYSDRSAGRVRAANANARVREHFDLSYTAGKWAALLYRVGRHAEPHTSKLSQS